MRTRLCEERGSYTVEFASISIFVTALLLLVVQMGLMKFAQESLTYAAREGAIYGGLTGSPADAQAAALQKVPNVVFIKAAQANVYPWPSQKFGRVKVTVTAKVPIIPIPLLSALVGDQIVSGTGYYVREKI